MTSLSRGSPPAVVEHLLGFDFRGEISRDAVGKSTCI